METLKFLLHIKALSHHASARELYQAEAVGRSVIVGKVVSISNKVNKSAPLKCVRLLEEPPLHMSCQNKDVVLIYLRNDYAHIELEIGSLVAVNPDAVTKSSSQTLQASLGFSNRNLGRIWIAHSSNITSKTNRSDVAVECNLEEECICLVSGWFNTPLMKKKTISKALEDVSCSDVSSFNLICKLLNVHHICENYSVIRVTDGTLFRWPVVYFDGFRFHVTALMDVKRYFIDILVLKTDGIHLVQENVLLKLYGVEVKKFELKSGMHHCFRTSGDPKKFKILLHSHVMKHQIEKALKTLTDNQRCQVLNRDCPGTSKSSDCHVLKSGVALQSSNSCDYANIKRNKACFKLSESSPPQGFSVDHQHLPTVNDLSGKKRQLQRVRAVTHTGDKKRTCISSAQHLKGGNPPVTCNLEYRRDKACKLMKSGITTLASNSSTDYSSSEEFLVDPPWVKIMNIDGGSKPPSPSGSVMCTKMSGTESEARIGVTKVPNPTVIKSVPEMLNKEIQSNWDSDKKSTNRSRTQFIENKSSSEDCLTGHNKQQPPWSANVMKPVKCSDMKSNYGHSAVEVSYSEGKSICLDSQHAVKCPNMKSNYGHSAVEVLYSEGESICLDSQHAVKCSDMKSNYGHSAVEVSYSEDKSICLDSQHASQESKQSNVDSGSDVSLKLQISDEECGNDLCQITQVHSLCISQLPYNSQ